MSIRQEAKKLQQYYESFPDWYWKFGLHDAKITLICEDFEKGRRFLDIHIDARGALFEREITRIRFYDYKIIAPEDISVFENGYWMGDSLEKLDSGKYLLKADVTCNNDKDLVHFEIRFANAETQRK